MTHLVNEADTAFRVARRNADDILDATGFSQRPLSDYRLPAIEFASDEERAPVRYRVFGNRSAPTIWFEPTPYFTDIERHSMLCVCWHSKRCLMRHMTISTVSSRYNNTIRRDSRLILANASGLRPVISARFRLASCALARRLTWRAIKRPYCMDIRLAATLPYRRLMTFCLIKIAASCRCRDGWEQTSAREP